MYGKQDHTPSPTTPHHTTYHHTQERFCPVQRGNLLNRSHTIHHIHFFTAPVQYVHTYVHMMSVFLQCEGMKLPRPWEISVTPLLNFITIVSTVRSTLCLSLSTAMNVHGLELECTPTGFPFTSIHIIVCVRLFKLPPLDRADHEEHYHCTTQVQHSYLEIPLPSVFMCVIQDFHHPFFPNT